MSAVKIVAIVLIMAGILGLVYGKLSYTKATHDVKLGPLELSVEEKQTVNVPIWAGGELLLHARKNSLLPWPPHASLQHTHHTQE